MMDYTSYNWMMDKVVIIIFTLFGINVLILILEIIEKNTCGSSKRLEKTYDKFFDEDVEGDVQL